MFVTALLPGEDEDAEELDGYHGQGELGNGGPGHPQLHLQYSDLQYTVSLNAVLRGSCTHLGPAQVMEVIIIGI